MDDSDIITIHNMADIVFNDSFIDSDDDNNSFLVIDSRNIITTNNDIINKFITIGFDQEYWSLSPEMIHNFFF